MKLIIKENRIVATATDAYNGPDQHIVAPEDFDLQRFGDYLLVGDQLEIDDTSRIARLWQAAHDWEFAQISGSAIGLLAMGVMLGKPKCLSVMTWIKSIWELYYTRKANGSADIDFSTIGPIPYSVPELMEEMG